MLNSKTEIAYSGDTFREVGSGKNTFEYTMGKDLGYDDETVDVKCETKDGVAKTNTVMASQTTKCAVSFSKTTIGTAGTWPKFDWGATGNDVKVANGLSSKDSKDQCKMTSCIVTTTNDVKYVGTTNTQYVTVGAAYPFDLTFKSNHDGKYTFSFKIKCTNGD